MDVHIIDISLGNIGSIVNILTRLGYRAVLISQPEDLRKAERVIFPGVGVFDKFMEILEAKSWIPALNEFVSSGKPIMGICLGMQIMAEYSEETNSKGLGWIKGQVVRFNQEKIGTELRIPHMGWNVIHSLKKNIFFSSIKDEYRFYFVHSYHFKCMDKNDRLTNTIYGNAFTSSVLKDNVLGVQFHPEKSHQYGFRLFRSFVEDFCP